jgi:hypothetical protein
VPHGSICAGIIAGRPAGGQRIVTGVAPRARLMILRGRATLRFYEYAVLDGADIILLRRLSSVAPDGGGTAAAEAVCGPRRVPGLDLDLAGR